MSFKSINPVVRYYNRVFTGRGLKMYCVMDFETRSPVDLKKCGAYAYAAHPMTEVMMLAVVLDTDDLARIWIPEKFRHIFPTELSDQDLIDIVYESYPCIAHNAFFERCIWKFKMDGQFGFKPIPLNKWFCTMAQSRRCGYPAALENAARVVLPKGEQKDVVGHNLMLQMSRVKRFTKKIIRNQDTYAYGLEFSEVLKNQEDMMRRMSIGERPKKDDWKYLHYREDEESFKRLVQYCKQDVMPEKELYETLPKQNSDEHAVWLLDQTINDRGFPVDRQTAQSAQKIVEAFERQNGNEAMELTQGEVTSLKSPVQIKEWLLSQGVETDSVDKQAIEDLLTQYLPDNVRQFLELRVGSGKSSTAKYAKLLMYSGNDARCHGAFAYYGASTGRWAGSGFQPQNLPRLSNNNHLGTNEEYAITEEDIQLIRSENAEMIELFWKDTKVFLTDCIRSMICASPGKKFYCADFSAIEARCIAWLAGEDRALEGYRQGLDAYKVAVSGILKIAYELVDDAQRRIGKTATLACGYGGGWGAMLKFGADRLGLTEAEGKQIVMNWRKSNPAIVRFWSGVEKCARQAVLNKGEEYRYNTVLFRADSRWLYVRLPSGRVLYYPEPEIRNIPYKYSRFYYFQEAYVKIGSAKAFVSGTQAIQEDVWASEEDRERILEEYDDVFTLYRLAEYLWRIQVNPDACLDGMLGYIDQPITVAKHGDTQIRLITRDGNFYYPISNTPSFAYIEEFFRGYFRIDVITTKTENIAKKFIRQPLTKVVLSENITQAVSRDILKEAMFRLEAKGYTICMHVHDEIVVEVDESFGSLDEFVSIMEQVPDWADGFPIKAEGWEGKRYRK